MTVRERIVQILKERGMTQTALAERMDKRVQWVNARLKGGTDIKADELPLFADALGISPMEFFATDAPTDREPFLTRWFNQIHGTLGDDFEINIRKRRDGADATIKNTDEISSTAEEIYRRLQQRLDGSNPEDRELLDNVVEFLKRKEG